MSTPGAVPDGELQADAAHRSDIISSDRDRPSSSSGQRSSLQASAAAAKAPRGLSQAGSSTHEALGLEMGSSRQRVGDSGQFIPDAGHTPTPPSSDDDMSSEDERHANALVAGARKRPGTPEGPAPRGGGRPARDLLAKNGARCVPAPVLLSLCLRCCAGASCCCCCCSRWH